jgi:hypothetical protein
MEKKTQSMRQMQIETEPSGGAPGPELIEKTELRKTRSMREEPIDMIEDMGFPLFDFNI